MLHYNGGSMIGQTLAHYQVLEKIGAGGMGEVYRARDTKLGREVAIKVLPPAFAQDPERRKRFEREAQLLASLNHPNIAAIYGLEESGGVHFLVLELVPGPTLAERLRDDRPAAEEVLTIASQIAEAFEEAHGKGVVHRDLKPANVKITPEGKVKVLDFGLAKAFAGEGPSAQADAPTRTAAILGTAAYMSPEQARGKDVDKRADVWAFGCVLYEALAGGTIFEKESISETLVAVLKGEPDWGRLPPDTPAAIRRLLRRCLQKDPRQRLHDIADARLDIEEALNPASQAAPVTAPAPPHRRTILPIVATILVAAATFAGGAWWRGSGSPEGPSWTGELLGGSSFALAPRVSPDGQMLAFAALVDQLSQVAVMKPGSGNWAILTKDRSRGLVIEMNWSRDGSKIYFDRFLDVPRGIFSVPVVGGEERLVLEDSFGPQVLPDGSLLVTRINPQRQKQLHRFWPETGRVEPLAAVTPTILFSSPVRAFPDGKEAVFFGQPKEAQPGSPDHLYAIDLASGRHRRLAPGVSLRAHGMDAFPLAVEADGRSVLFSLPSGNLQQIVAAPRDGGGSLRTVLTLTMSPWNLDVGPDGSLYLDQLDRPAEVLRFPASGGSPERLAVVPTMLYAVSLPLADGRTLLPSRIAGRNRLLLVTPGKDPSAFLDTQEETTTPGSPVGPGEVAFLAGPAASRTIAVASISEGRIVRRLKAPRASIEALASSPDGKTLYYVSEGVVWAVPSTDGEPRKIHGGDGVAVDPRGNELVLQLIEKERIRLVRVPVAGGPEQEIPIRGDLRLTPTPITPTAIGPDQRIVVQVSAVDSWFWGIAILDPRSGKLERVPLTFEGDLISPGWTSDGRIISIGLPLHAGLWRFRPAPR